MRTLLLMGIAMLAAGIIPIQAIVNGRLGQEVQNPLLAALISFAGGTIALGLLLVVSTRGLPTVPQGAELPWFLWTGGLLGAVFVTVVLILVPKIGTANVLAAAIVGQLLMSLVVDHYSLLGVPQSSISLAKIGGVLLLVTGMLLIQRG